jgi:hypothetical protein
MLRKGEDKPENIIEKCWKDAGKAMSSPQYDATVTRCANATDRRSSTSLAFTKYTASILNFSTDNLQIPYFMC